MKCTFCKSQSIITTTEREIVCKSCGVVQGMESPDPITFTSTQQDQTMFHDKGLGTVSGTKAGRFRNIENRMHSYGSNKTIMRANILIKTISEKMGLPGGITSDAAKIFHQMYKINAIPKRNVDPMVGACVFMACRRAGTSILIIDVAKAMYRPDLRKKIWKTYRRIVNLEIYNVPPALTAEKFIMKLIRKMNFDQQIANHAINIALKIKKRRLLAGLHPLGIAAACIFLVMKRNKQDANLPDLADSANISQVTIREKVRFIIAKMKTGEMPPYEEAIKPIP